MEEERWKEEGGGDVEAEVGRREEGSHLTILSPLLGRNGADLDALAK